MCKSSAGIRRVNSFGQSGKELAIDAETLNRGAKNRKPGYHTSPYGIIEDVSLCFLRG